MPEDLTERTFKFACDAYDFCDDLSRQPGLPRRIAYQLFDAAGSVGANRHESRRAPTRPDFRAKNAISLKESKEALFWLRLTAAKSLGNPRLRTALTREADELVAIFTKTVKSLGS